MALEQNVTAARRWFTREDKSLRYVVAGNDGVTPIDVSAWTFRWVCADDPEGAVEIEKLSADGEISVGGAFNPTPGQNGQYVDVDINSADTETLFKGKHWLALWRWDPGFRQVLAFGYWDAQKAAGGS